MLTAENASKIATLNCEVETNKLIDEISKTAELGGLSITKREVSPMAQFILKSLGYSVVTESTNGYAPMIPPAMFIKISWDLQSKEDVMIREISSGVFNMLKYKAADRCIVYLGVDDIKCKTFESKEDMFIAIEKMEG